MAQQGRRLTTLERAFEMARSGEFDSSKGIARSLVQEGFDQVASHLSGPAIKKTLARLCIASREQTAGQVGEKTAIEAD